MVMAMAMVMVMVMVMMVMVMVMMVMVMVMVMIVDIVGSSIPWGRELRRSPWRALRHGLQAKLRAQRSTACFVPVGGGGRSLEQ